MSVIRTEAPLDDEALVTRARAGDLEAYNLLVARHTASAYRTAVLLGAGSDSEDVIQEAFVKAYRKLSRFRGDSSFRSWLAAEVALPGLSVYGASKAALDLLTKSWAAEFGPAGVRVNSVRPGPTRTPGSAALGDALGQLAAQAPLGFVADPEDIAAVIAFLISDEARFVTGVILDADGGRTAV